MIIRLVGMYQQNIIDSFLLHRDVFLGPANVPPSLLLNTSISFSSFSFLLYDISRLHFLFRYESFASTCLLETYRVSFTCLPLRSALCLIRLLCARLSVRQSRNLNDRAASSRLVYNQSTKHQTSKVVTACLSRHFHSIANFSSHFSSSSSQLCQFLNRASLAESNPAQSSQTRASSSRLTSAGFRVVR